MVYRHAGLPLFLEPFFLCRPIVTSRVALVLELEQLYLNVLRLNEAIVLDPG